MSTRKKSSAGLDSATRKMQAEARKRRLAMHQYWEENPQLSIADVGRKFGVTRQRASYIINKLVNPR